MTHFPKYCLHGLGSPALSERFADPSAGEAAPDAGDREAGLRRIREMLAEAHRVDTREHDLEAARTIDRILQTTGLNLHSPELQASGIDAEEIQGLRATSFGESMRGFVSAMVPSFMK